MTTENTNEQNEMIANAPKAATAKATIFTKKRLLIAGGVLATAAAVVVGGPRALKAMRNRKLAKAAIKAAQGAAQVVA